MNKFLFLCTISMVFGISLIVSGGPISSNIADLNSGNSSSSMVVPFAPSDDGLDTSDENSTDTNGTHKEL